VQEPQSLVFGPFRLDLRDERLWRGQEVLPLFPKAFAVLRCLVTQAGQLVGKDALLETVWPRTAVSESVLTVAIRGLRRVLGDCARAPSLSRRCTVGGIGSRPRSRCWSHLPAGTRRRGRYAPPSLSPSYILDSLSGARAN